MSSKERSAWISLVTTVLVLGPYFAWIWLRFQQGNVTSGEVWQAFTLAVVLQGVATLGTHVALRGRYGSEAADERDAAIELTSLRRAHGVLLATVVLLLAISTWLVPVSFVAAGQLILLCIALSEVAKHGSVVWQYRHGLHP